MLKMLMLSGMFTILHLLVSLIFTLTPFLPQGKYDFPCGLMTGLKDFLYCLGMLMIYLYIWMRMKFYYEMYAETNSTRSRCFIAMTWISLGFMILGGITLYAAHKTITSDSFMYDQEKNKCIQNKSSSNQFPLFVGLGIFQTVTQLNILALIVSVFLKQRKCVETNSQSTSGNRLARALKKLVVPRKSWCPWQEQGC